MATMASFFTIVCAVVLVVLRLNSSYSYSYSHGHNKTVVSILPQDLQ